MDPISAAISVGGSLLGGLFGSKREDKAIARQNAYNDPQNIRERAERAGFNPLLFVGPGVGNQTATGGSNYMGAAIADAALTAADALAKNSAKQRLSKVMDDNARLRDQLTRQTIRPKIVGGIYSGNEAMPSVAEALGGGGSSGRNSSVAGAGVAPAGGGAYSLGFPVDPLLEVDPLDPRRKVDNLPVTTDPGYGVVDSPALGKPFRVPSYNGELLDVWQMPVFAGSWYADRLARFGYSIGQKQTAKTPGAFSSGGTFYAPYPSPPMLPAYRPRGSAASIKPSGKAFRQ